MNLASFLLDTNTQKSNRQTIISSRIDLEELQDTGERAIRWLRRYRQHYPKHYA